MAVVDGAVILVDRQRQYPGGCYRPRERLTPQWSVFDFANPLFSKDFFPGRLVRPTLRPLPALPCMRLMRSGASPHPSYLRIPDFPPPYPTGYPLRRRRVASERF